jgi:hypothetical protein
MAEALDPNTPVTTEDVQVSSVSSHSRAVTGALAGRLRVGSWDYPYRIFDGRVQYNSARDGSGDWKDAPATAKRV